jgi:hypothetical protein
MNSMFNFSFMETNVGRNDVVARTTRYGLDSPGVESR